MRSAPWPLAYLGVVFLSIAGCGNHPNLESPPPGTGAREAAENFFAALLRKDWPTAYQLLDADSKSRTSVLQFAQRAQDYCRHLGFAPSQVFVLACDEHGPRAIAHVSLRGVAGSSPRVFKDAIGLSRGTTGWAMALPAKFGQKKAKRRLPS